MGKAIRVLRPLTVTPANIVFTDVPDTDYAEWAAGSTYAANAYVKKGVKVYRSLLDGNVGADPADQVNNAAKWKPMGVINRMKPFDERLATKVRQANVITYHLNFGRAITSLVVKGVEGGEYITVRMLVDGAVVYYAKTPMFGVPSESGMWHWLFGARDDIADASFFNLPTYPQAVVEVEVTGSSSLAIGAIAAGNVAEYGEHVLTGSGVSIANYALNGFDEWGDPVILPLSWAKTATIDVLLRRHEVDALQKVIANARYSPSIWIGSDMYESLNIYGFVENFDVPLEWDFPQARITIKGLPENDQHPV